MKVELFALCDAATESGGKLNVLGIFDVMAAPDLPFFHPACAVAIRLRFKRIESGTHRVKLDIVDLDGRHTVPSFETTVTVQSGDEVDSSVANLLLNFQQLRFDRYGRYSIDLAVDGRHEGSLPVYLRLVSSPSEKPTH